MHSWRVLILPYIEQNDLYKAYNFEEAWDGPNNRKLAARMPNLYALPGEERPGNTTANYLAVVGPETIWHEAAGVPMEDVKESTSHTILMVENKGAGVHWMEPRDLEFAQMDFTLNSPKGISSRYVDPAVVMVDCSVFRLTEKMDPEALRAMLTINHGDKVAWDEGHGWYLLPDGRQRPVRQP